jgi:hypothetical protein
MSELVTAPPHSSGPTRSRAASRELWLDRLARFPLSGLTAAQFCSQEGVSLPSFYSWKRRLAAPAPEQAQSAEQQALPSHRLLPVLVQSSSVSVELLLRSGALLRLPAGCDLAWVRSLVAALGDLPC